MDTWLLTWVKKLAQISLLSKHLQSLQQTSAVLTTKEFKCDPNCTHGLDTRHEEESIWEPA